MKKRIAGILTFLIIISQFVVPVSANDAELLVADDFNSITPGTDYILSDGKYKLGSIENVVTVCNDGDGLGNYVEIDSKNIPEGNSCGVGFSVNKLEGKSTYSFDYRRITRGAHFYINGDTGFTMSSILANPPYYFDNAAESNYMNGIIPANRWFNITAVVDCDADSVDVYVDGYKIADKIPVRKGTVNYVNNVRIYNDGKSEVIFNVKNVRCYSGEKIPVLTDYAAENFVPAEAPLVNFSDGINTVSTALPDSYAMFAGYPVAYCMGGYALVDEDKDFLAPVIKNGYIYAPAGFAAQAFGGIYDKNKGTITKGSTSASFSEGTTTEVSPAPPAVIDGVLYIPICSELGAYFNTPVYTDARGLVITGISSTPGESVIKPLINELRSRSAVFGKGVNSEVLFSSRWYRTGEDNVWSTLDAAKRFMATSTRWTYINSGVSRENVLDIGTNVQTGLNASPTTQATDTDGNKLTYEYEGTKYNVWVGSAYNIEGNLYIREDGLGNWGCVNNSQYFEDILNKAKDGIDLGSYLWQFDDYALNANYRGGCFCDYCMDAFGPWLVDNGYTTERLLSAGRITSAEAEWIENNGGIESFNYKKYLNENKNIITNSDYQSKKSGISMQILYNAFNYDMVHQWHKELRVEINKYADEKGVDFYMSANMSDLPGGFKNNSRMRFFDVLDGAMGETSQKNIAPGAIFAGALSEQVYDVGYITSLWVKRGKTSMQMWESAVPLMYATGQNSLIPWDDWVYNSTRYYCNPEELEGNYAFVREYPHLFDNYDTPATVGYIYDFDQNDGLTAEQLHSYALDLAKKGIPSKAIGQRLSGAPYLTVDADDYEGLENVVNVNGTPLSDAEISALSIKGEDVVAMNGYDGDFETGFNGQDGSNGNASYTVVNDSQNALLHDSYLEVKSEAGCTSARFNDLKTGVEIGKEYEISFYAKSGDSSEHNVSVWVSQAFPGTNTYFPVKIESHSEAVDGTAWKKVTATVVIAAHTTDGALKLAAANAAKAGKTGEDAQKAYDEVLNPSNWWDRGFHIGVNISNAGTVYIDNFQVKEKNDIIRSKGFDGQFESDSTYDSGGGSYEVVKVTDSSAQSGYGYVEAKNNTSDTIAPVRFDFLSDGIEIGKKYEFSFYARVAEGTSNVTPMISKAYPGTNTLYPTTVSCPTESVGTEWKKITSTFTVDAYTPEHEDKTGAEAPSTWTKMGIHTGIYVPAGKTVYIDNVQLREIPAEYTYSELTSSAYGQWEANNWSARINGMPDDIYAVLRTNTLYSDAPVVVHAVSYKSELSKDVKVELNNKYLPEGDSLTVKIYSPLKNPVSQTVTRDSSGITTVNIDELDNWAVLEISGADTKSLARFDVDGYSGIGIGSRVSYDSAEGTSESFTITTYGEGLNRYTQNDIGSGQDEAGYVYRRIETDDFEISAQVDAISGSSGLMIREDVYSNAPMVAIVYDSQNGLRLAKRATANCAVSYTTLGASMPRYIKLKSVNNVVTALTSNDGVTWTKAGSTAVLFTPGVAGAFATSSDGTKAECSVSNMSLTGTDAALEIDVNSENLFAIRNHTFKNGLVNDYVVGYDSLYSNATPELTSEGADGDTNALKLTQRVDGNASPYYRYLPIENGKTYEASVWVKVDEGVSETGSIIAELPVYGDSYEGIKNEGTVTIKQIDSQSASLTGEWQRVYNRFTVSETGLAQGVNIRLVTDGNSDVYIDNFEFKEVHSVGNNLNVAITKYTNKAVLDISTNDGSTREITYAMSVKKTNGGAERVSYTHIDHITVTGTTQSIEINLSPVSSSAEFYIWETDSIAPVIRSFRIEK